ncbi:hypothetical protein O7635_15560 [Asanoa sp. WMMD1127]|uniref:hypothetical protein n=1 Tax=Asanoa sp. WMMD1127 TaxID=3016107 RepID=UPI0024174843|nr:hypothetical protein [Asanoa sp. WMMD1127]MDG4823273.1 hypothetical protein [Asanoa sp. WMMD1127]
MRGTNNSKFSAVVLVRDHFDTLRNFDTKQPRPTDYLVYLGSPVLIAAVTWWFEGRARNIPDVLAAVAIFTGLIFNVFVLLFDLTARATDRLPMHAREIVDQLADELRAKVSYAVFVGILFTTYLGGLVMFADTDKPLDRTLTALIIMVGIHMLLTIFMVLKRVRAMFRALRIDYTERVP